jgi:hypothetical protein
MGREVRMIPAGWEHPKERNQYHGMFYKPLLPDFAARHAEWVEDKAKWAEGFVRDYANGGWKPKDNKYSFEELIGAEPNPAHYMPDFEPGTATMFVMYEDTSEGTPISPAFATPEELARWLADNGASSFGSNTASYEAWLSTIKRGSAPSAIFSSAGLQSGVEALHDTTPSPEPKREAETDEIHSMICLSTAHISDDTRQMLVNYERNEFLPVFYEKSDYGWFIHVSTDHLERVADYPQDIQAILAYARARGCGWVMLDSDGPVVDGLKTWEW